MLSLYTLLAATTPPAEAPSLLGRPELMIPVMIALMYFLFFRPQQMQRKEQEKRMAALQKGDSVVTNAGIHAFVHNVKEKTVVLKVCEGVLIEFDKQAIASVSKKETAAVTETK